MMKQLIDFLYKFLLRRRRRIPIEDRPPIVQVFAKARVNGAFYRGDQFKPNAFKFPGKTWLDKQLEKVRRESARRS